jgi:hypothetical protein
MLPQHRVRNSKRCGHEWRDALVLTGSRREARNGDAVRPDPASVKLQEDVTRVAAAAERHEDPIALRQPAPDRLAAERDEAVDRLIPVHAARQGPRAPT